MSNWLQLDGVIEKKGGKAVNWEEFNEALRSIGFQFEGTCREFTHEELLKEINELTKDITKEDFERANQKAVSFYGKDSTAAEVLIDNFGSVNSEDILYNLIGGEKYSKKATYLKDVNATVTDAFDAILGENIKHIESQFYQKKNS